MPSAWAPSWLRGSSLQESEPILRAASTLFAISFLALSSACHRSAPAGATDAASRDAGKAAESISFLGGERGLDHVGIAVVDLDATTHAYHDLLGFSRPTEGRLPNGIRNVNYYFADATYLETLVYWDRTKASWLAQFTDKHQGGFFAVMSAFSVQSTGAFLAQRGIKVSAPYSGTIQTAGEDAMPEEKWQTFFLPNGVLPGDPLSLYFIAYKRGPRDEFLHKLENPKLRKQLFHKNTALGLRAVWYAVPDLAAAAKAYESIGLSRHRAFKDEELGADGQVLIAGTAEGEVRLLAPNTPNGVVSKFIAERGGPGILGVTLLAGNINTASSVIAAGTGVPMPIQQGMEGMSFRVPPELAQGVYLEFTQQ